MPFIRVPDATEGDIQKATDLGAVGIIIPMVDAVEKVRTPSNSLNILRSESGARAEASTARSGAGLIAELQTTTS